MLLNITSDMREKQGLDPEKWYEAVVVENDDRKHPDKMMMGRVQARIAVIFDGVPDSDLPWAIPMWQHPDGAHATSGFFSVPKKGSKVFLYFQQGNPAFPIYRGFHVDVQTQMEETKYNYPDRAVVRFQNKAMIIVDTKDNTCYIRNPGNLKIYIDGNVEMQINGDVDELIRGTVRRRILGDLHEEVEGSRHYHTTGELKERVDQSVWRQCGGNANYESEAQFIIEGGPNIYENCGMAKGSPGRSNLPIIHKWPGVPGSGKGTNTRNKPTKSSCGQQSPEYSKDSTPSMVNAGIAGDPEQ